LRNAFLGPFKSTTTTKETLATFARSAAKERSETEVIQPTQEVHLITKVHESTLSVVEDMKIRLPEQPLTRPLPQEFLLNDLEQE
jgi:hypothetical protein